MAAICGCFWSETLSKEFGPKKVIKALKKKKTKYNNTIYYI